MSSSTATNSSDENMDEAYVTYSTAMHKAIAFINVGALGLLQVVTNQSSAETKALFGGGFLVLIVIYAILGVWEDTLQNQLHFRNFIGHIRHLVGALAATALISLIFSTFAFILLILSIGWFLFIMYRSFTKPKVLDDERV